MKPLYVILKELAAHLYPVYGDEDVAYAKAWTIVEHCTGLSKAILIARRDIFIDAERLNLILHELVYEYKPLDYILGDVAFGELTLTVRPPILIPRPETEWWCDLVGDRIVHLVSRATLEKPFTILDIGTGTGCLSLVLSSRFKKNNIRILGLDKEPQAITLARENAERNNLECEFILSDVYDALPRGFKADLIVTNPPYIAEEMYTALDASVRLWEDKNALVAPENGLALMRKIIYEAPSVLRHDYDCAELWCEIGYDQGVSAYSLFAPNLWTDVMLLRDLADLPRVVKAKLLRS